MNSPRRTSIARAREVGAAGLAGDLCIDGAIGSRTAAVAQPYADADTHGARYLSDDEIREHLVECTRAGLQAGFHCIGDDAVAAAVGGIAAGRRAGGGRSRSAPPGTGWNTWRWSAAADIPDAGRRWAWWPACNRPSTPGGAVPASCTSSGWARIGRRR